MTYVRQSMQLHAGHLPNRLDRNTQLIRNGLFTATAPAALELTDLSSRPMLAFGLTRSFGFPPRASLKRIRRESAHESRRREA